MMMAAIIFAPQSARASSTDFTNKIQRIWIEPLKDMTAQIVAMGTAAIPAIGAMLDDMQTPYVQLEMQRLHTIAIKDYMPGENLCRFGTLGRSLASSEVNVQATSLTLNDIMQRRETGNSFRIDPFADMDRISRMISLKILYCNPGDNDKTHPACNCNLVTGVCTAPGPLPSRFNRDLDFARLLGSRLTLDINFTDYDTATPANSPMGQMTADEQDLIAFLYNVTAPGAFDRFSQSDFSDRNSKVAANAVLSERNMYAMRSLVRNSLAQQIAKKVPGSPGVRTYMINVMRELGTTDAEARRILQTEGLNLDRPGNAASTTVINPSYDAQMEILTKKLYQNPNFYVNLIDKPANVNRQQASMMAINLMQRRDIFEILLRREMLLAALVELKTREETEAANSRVNEAMASSGFNRGAE